MTKYLFLALAMCLPISAMAETFEQQLGKVEVSHVDQRGAIQVPFIIWGGDVATFTANGGLTTAKDSIYQKSGLNFKLVPGDDFHSQVKDYLTGKSPYLRCTLGMASLASEVLNKDRRTKPIIIMQMTWSAGDHIVARDTVKNLNGLKGKKICLQRGGPHLTLVEDSLKAAGLQWDDITVVWAKNLTGPDSPSEIFKKDKSIDACCVISPDMIGLCSSIEQTGSGAEGTVKGAHVVNSTASMSHSIADVYIVRWDYYNENREQVEKFVAGYLKATEQLLEWKSKYDDGKGKSPEYLKALTMAQNIYGKEVLPTIENDAHGLVADATFVRIPGNEAFFDDPNNLTGFDAKTSSALDMSKSLGMLDQRYGFNKPNWDYKHISELAGVKYVKPVYATGRVKGEITDFTKDLDTNTIFSFDIKFEPEQTTFNLDTYAADFQRVAEAQANFGNALFLIRGHSDPTLAMQNFFWAAQAKGLITGSAGNYKFSNQPLDLSNTESIVNLIQTNNFNNLFRVNKEGNKVSIDDPKSTVAAAIQLSQIRAENVRKTLQEFSKARKYSFDISQVQPQGVGVSEPKIARPKNINQAKDNMRVEVRVIRVKAEALKEGDFEFDN